MTTQQLRERHKARSLTVVAQNEGGVGKTYFATHLHAAFEACGMTCRVIDLDFGNRAASILLPADPVPWGGNRSLAPIIMRDLEEADAIVVDVGANILIDGQYMELVDELIRCAHDGERDTRVYVPQIPNKAGHGRIAEIVAEKFSTTASVTMVLNDADGSGNFPEVGQSFPKLRLGHVEAGFVAARMDDGRQLLDYILRGDGNFSAARGLWAHYLLVFMQDPAIAPLLPTLTDEPVVQELRAMARSAQRQYTVSAKAQARNDKLLANERCREAFIAFLKGGEGDGFSHRASIFYNAYHNL